MSDTKYIGEWQTKITKIAEAAATQGTVLYVTDVWNLATVGKTSNDPSCLLDALRPLVEAGRVSLLGEATPEVLRAIGRVAGFAHLFQQVAVAPLSPAQVDQVLDRVAARDGLAVDPGSRRALVRTTSRFLPGRPQPGGREPDGRGDRGNRDDGRCSLSSLRSSGPAVREGRRVVRQRVAGHAALFA